MQEALVEQHREKNKNHESQVASVQFQYRLADRKLAKAYDDHLNGLIDETLWQTVREQLSGDKARLQRLLESVSQD